MKSRKNIAKLIACSLVWKNWWYFEKDWEVQYIKWYYLKVFKRLPWNGTLNNRVDELFKQWFKWMTRREILDFLIK